MNPFQQLLEECDDDPSKIQSAYETHRTNRNAQQRAKILDPAFTGMSLDPILLGVLAAKAQGIPEDEIDNRHCLVFWARPPTHVQMLARNIQLKLLEYLPNLYLVPLERMHMNTLEITHSKTKEQIDGLVKSLESEAETIADYPFHHRTELIRPLLGYDTSAIALTYVPAAATGVDIREEEGEEDEEEPISNRSSYHVLRRDLFDLCTRTGVTIDQRYTVPSAHMTIARFVRPDDFTSAGDGREVDESKVRKWIDGLEKINEWLRREYWAVAGDSKGRRDGATWSVGEEYGLDHRRGTLWYGGGETICLGKGFKRW